jgi:hypothetical protein
MKSTKQQRHDLLLTWASQFELYRLNNNCPSFFEESLTRDKLNPEFLKPTDINPAVILFTDALNLPAGSFGDVELYKLLQVYLTDSEKRHQINQLL